jgi:hypothetical protein
VDGLYSLRGFSELLGIPSEYDLPIGAERAEFIAIGDLPPAVRPPRQFGHADKLRLHVRNGTQSIDIQKPSDGSK